MVDRIPRTAAHERTAMCCELCTAPIADPHGHVVELGACAVLCACRPCTLLFDRGAPGSKYRTVPERVRIDARLALRPERLGIPLGIACCYRDSVRDQFVASYPGPAGLVDAALAPSAWDALTAATPLAAQLVPDVEALLLRSEHGGGVICYLVPITAAHELTSRLRTGITGGEPAIDAFFAELDAAGRAA